MKLYLASKSKRRKELLAQMGIEFDLLLVDTPEIIAPGETPEAYSMRVTREKLEAAKELIIKQNLPDFPILCADTEVVLDEKIMGKPHDREEAFRMLKCFSGRSHDVITSVGIIYHEYDNVVLQKTRVTFGEMSDVEINHYLDMNDYKDKSGSYGIQSYIGQFIANINGDFYSVMGLPLNTVRTLIKGMKEYIGKTASLRHIE